MGKSTLSIIAAALLAANLSATDSVIEASATVYNNAIDPYMTDATRSITSYGATVLGAYNSLTGEYSNLLGDMPSDTPLHVDANHNGYWDDVPYSLPMIVSWNGSAYVANGYYATVTGNGAIVDGYGGTAYGSYARTNGIVASSYGYESSASTHYASAFGSFSSASGLASTSIGAYANSSADYSFAGGVFATSTGIGGISIGLLSNSSGYYSTAIGPETIASGSNSVAIGSYSKATSAYEFSVGNADTGLTRRITNVSTPIDGTDATNKNYVDQAILNINAGGGMDYAYTDQGDQSVRDYADQGDARTLSEAKAYTDSIKQELRKEMHDSTALALALSSPAVIEPGRENGMSVAVGQYKSSAALGISYSRRTRSNEFFNVGISTVGGNVATRSSYNFSF